MDEIPQLYRQTRRAASWGIALSLALGLVKLLGGVYGHSFALETDAVHSFVDAIISGTLLVALIFAERPADREHPYGHTRVEAVAAACIALFLIALSLWIGWEAWITRGRPHPAPLTWTVVIAAAGALFQEGFYRYANRTAKRTGSVALLATSWDYRLDAFSSIMVLIGVAVARWGGSSWRWADHAAAVVVVVTILWVGIRLLWENVQELMDHQADPELLKTVRREALAVPGVRGVEKLRIRKSGLVYLVDIHVEVDPEITVREGHAIAHAVKDRIIREVVPIGDVLVHIEPAREPRPSVRTKS